jgi:plasmid maintenance system antidote protein VapI
VVEPDEEVPTSDRSALTSEMALRLEAALGITAESWLNLERDHDLERLRNRMGAELARVRRRALLAVDPLEA